LYLDHVVWQVYQCKRTLSETPKQSLYLRRHLATPTGPTTLLLGLKVHDDDDEDDVVEVEWIEEREKKKEDEEEAEVLPKGDSKLLFLFLSLSLSLSPSLSLSFSFRSVALDHKSVAMGTGTRPCYNSTGSGVTLSPPPKKKAEIGHWVSCSKKGTKRLPIEQEKKTTAVMFFYTFVARLLFHRHQFGVQVRILSMPPDALCVISYSSKRDFKVQDG
jgi:hypothetical protein